MATLPNRPQSSNTTTNNSNNNSHQKTFNKQRPNSSSNHNNNKQYPAAGRSHSASGYNRQHSNNNSSNSNNNQQQQQQQINGVAPKIMPTPAPKISFAAVAASGVKSAAAPAPAALPTANATNNTSQAAAPNKSTSATPSSSTTTTNKTNNANTTATSTTTTNNTNSNGTSRPTVNSSNNHAGNAQPSASAPSKQQQKASQKPAPAPSKPSSAATTTSAKPVVEKTSESSSSKPVFNNGPKPKYVNQVQSDSNSSSTSATKVVFGNFDKSETPKENRPSSTNTNTHSNHGPKSHKQHIVVAAAPANLPPQQQQPMMHMAAYAPIYPGIPAGAAQNIPVGANVQPGDRSKGPQPIPAGMQYPMWQPYYVDYQAQYFTGMPFPGAPNMVRPANTAALASAPQGPARFTPTTGIPQGAPAVVPTSFNATATPRKSTAVKIVNPNTGKPVELPSKPANTAATSTVKPPVTSTYAKATTDKDAAKPESSATPAATPVVKEESSVKTVPEPCKPFTPAPVAQTPIKESKSITEQPKVAPVVDSTDEKQKVPATPPASGSSQVVFKDAQGNVIDFKSLFAAKKRQTTASAAPSSTTAVSATPSTTAAPASATSSTPAADTLAVPSTVKEENKKEVEPVTAKTTPVSAVTTTAVPEKNVVKPAPGLPEPKESQKPATQAPVQKPQARKAEEKTATTAVAPEQAKKQKEEQPVKQQKTEVMEDEELEEGEVKESAITKLTSFENVKYPSTITKPTIDAKNTIRYAKDFLMAFSKVIKERPEGLPSVDEIYADSTTTATIPSNSTRGGYKSAVGRTMSRSSSATGPSPTSYKNSEERFQASMEKRGAPRPTTSKSPSMMAGAPMSRNASSRGGSRRGRGGRFDGHHQQQQHQHNQHNHHHHYHQQQQQQEVLKISESGWAPTFLKKKSDDNKDQQAKIEEVMSREIISILNRLTPEKFASLSNQILAMDITTPELLNVVVDRIFDKALSEAYYGEMYARLCYKLFIELPKRQKWVITEVVTSDGRKAQQNALRSALLAKCQKEFENGATWAQEEQEFRVKLRDPELSNEIKEQLLKEQENRYKVKIRSLGNVRFVGELFKLKMISPMTMHKCVYDLLNQTEPEEEQTESLCKLMTTVGAYLDLPEAKEFMNSYFEQIESLSQNTILSSRIRFMLMDLIDLRSNKWVPRNKQAGPTTLSQIRLEAERKEAAAASAPKMNRNDSKQSSRGGMGNSRTDKRSSFHRSDSSSSNNNNNNQEWSTVSSSNAKSSSKQEYSQFGSLSKTDKSQIKLMPDVGKKWNISSNSPITNVKKSTSSSAKEESGSGISSKANNNMFGLLSENHEEDEEEIITKPVDEEKKPAMSRDAVQKRINGTFSEWTSIYDRTEVIENWKELGTAEYNEEFCSIFVTNVMEQKLDCVVKTASLLSQMIKEEYLNIQDFISAVANYNELLDDMAMDIPNVYKLMATLFALIVADGVLGLERLSDAFGALMDMSNSANKLIGMVFQELVASKGLDDVKYILQEAVDFDLKEFLPVEKQKDEAAWKVFLAKYNLESLFSSTASLKELVKKLRSDKVESVVEKIKSAVSEDDRSASKFISELSKELIDYANTKINLGKSGLTPEGVKSLKLTMNTQVIPVVKSGIAWSLVEDSDNAKVIVLHSCHLNAVDLGLPASYLETLFQSLLDSKIVSVKNVIQWKDQTKQHGGVHDLKTLEHLKSFLGKF